MIMHKSITMPEIMDRFRSSCSVLGFCLIAGFLFAQPATARAQGISTVYKKNNEKFGGEITAVTKTSVTVNQKVGNRTEEIPANDILYIEWKGEPPALSLARSNERSGNYAEAVAGYQESLSALDSSANWIKADINFMLARTAASIAKADITQAASAIQQLKTYTSENRDFYRFFDAQLVLAETALMADDPSTAEAAFTVLQSAPWPDYQLAGKLGNAETLLARDDINGAKAIFDQVAATTPNSPREKQRQLEGRLGQAECLQRQNQYAEASTVLQTVIDETTAEDTRILAEAYLKLGDSYSAQGQQNKEAILAYLHIDVIPSLAAEADLHAEALFRLSKLWTAVNQPTRSADAAAKLETEYPNSPWTKQLGGGS